MPDQMKAVRSPDGTEIAFDRQGSGPAVILVGGGLDDGSENAPLAHELAKHFTVYNVARRGRGGSGDMQPYALEREFEDLQAVMDEAGGPAHLYGASTGGALVLEAAAAGMAAGKLAVYEVPYNLAPEWPILWREYVAKMRLALARDGRGDAIDLFLRVTGSAESDIASAHTSPFWPALKSLAHTLAYDAACLGDGWPPTDRLAKISQPTLVLTGDEPPANAAGWIRALDAAADAIVASIPKGQRQTVRGQGHVVNPTTFAPVLVQFFGIEDGSPLHANLSR